MKLVSPIVVEYKSNYSVVWEYRHVVSLYNYTFLWDPYT